MPSFYQSASRTSFASSLEDFAMLNPHLTLTIDYLGEADRGSKPRTLAWEKWDAVESRRRRTGTSASTSSG